MFGITFLTGFVLSPSATLGLSINTLSLQRPFVVLGGATVSIFKRFRPQLWLAWVFAVIGAATLSTYDVETPLARAIGLTVIGAAGAGLLFGMRYDLHGLEKITYIFYRLGATYFPVLSPLHVTQNARALALFAFFRAFAGVCLLVLQHGAAY